MKRRVLGWRGLDKPSLDILPGCGLILPLTGVSPSSMKLPQTPRLQTLSTVP